MRPRRQHATTGQQRITRSVGQSNGLKWPRCSQSSRSVHGTRAAQTLACGVRGVCVHVSTRGSCPRSWSCRSHRCSRWQGPGTRRRRPCRSCGPCPRSSSRARSCRRRRRASPAAAWRAWCCRTLRRGTRSISPTVGARARCEVGKGAGYGRSPLSSAMSSSTRSIGQPSSMHLSAASSRPIETAARSGAVAVRGAKGRRNASVPAAKRARARRRRAIIVSLRSDSHGNGRRERRAEAGVHCCSVEKLASRVSPSDDRA